MELRAARAARILRDAGFTDVSVLNGGYRLWRRKGFPLEGRG
jgi:rhodanese-related sulfurtransferase